MNNFQKAIDIISNKSIMCGEITTAIIVEIAKSNPSVLVKACGKMKIMYQAFEYDVIDLYESAGKISAIKLYREKTGFGLKESKEAVEKLMGIS